MAKHCFNNDCCYFQNNFQLTKGLEPIKATLNKFPVSHPPLRQITMQVWSISIIPLLLMDLKPFIDCLLYYCSILSITFSQGDVSRSLNLANSPRNICTYIEELKQMFTSGILNNV